MRLASFVLMGLIRHMQGRQQKNFQGREGEQRIKRPKVSKIPKNSTMLLPGGDQRKKDQK